MVEHTHATPNLHSVGKDMNFTASVVLDAILLISKTAVKNIDMGEQFGNRFNFIIEALQQQILMTDYERSFRLFHKVSLFKQMAQNVWHGSVIASILDNNIDLLNLCGIGETISASVNLRENSTNSTELWENLKSIANQQNDARLNAIVANGIQNGQLSAADVTTIAQVFNATEDYVKIDFERFRNMGYNKRFFETSNLYRECFFLDHNILLSDFNYDFKFIQDIFEDDTTTVGATKTSKVTGISVNQYREFWLACFRNKIAVPMEEFIYQTALACQLFHQKLDLFFNKHMIQLLVQSAPSMNYTVDLRKHKEFVRQVVNMVTARNPKAKATDNPEPRPTVPTKSGKSITIKREGFDLQQLRNHIHEMKRGDNGNQDIRLQFTQESHCLDEKVQDLVLKGQVLRGNGQRYYTIGNTFECDIQIPKTGIILGTQLGIEIRDHGKIFVQDLSSSDDKIALTMKLVKDVPYKIKQGQVISFTASFDYHVEILTHEEMKLTHMRTVKPDAEAANTVASYHHNIPEKGLTIGRAPNCKVIINKKSCTNQVSAI
eukprot:403330673